MCATLTYVRARPPPGLSASRGLGPCLCPPPSLVAPGWPGHRRCLGSAPESRGQALRLLAGVPEPPISLQHVQQWQGRRPRPPWFQSVLIRALPPPGKPHLLPAESKEKPAGSIDSYLKSANSWLAEKKDIAERLLKNTSAKTENVKGFFGLETKPKGPPARRSE